MGLPAAAQVASSELSGTILDSTGAAVATVKVTATNIATNLAREAVSDASGGYRITLLPPGDYTVVAEAFNVFNHPPFGLPNPTSETVRPERLPAPSATPGNCRWDYGSSSNWIPLT